VLPGFHRGKTLMLYRQNSVLFFELMFFKVIFWETRLRDTKNEIATIKIVAIWNSKSF
jgi:hypothetical protein